MNKPGESPGPSHQTNKQNSNKPKLIGSDFLGDPSDIIQKGRSHSDGESGAVFLNDDTKMGAACPVAN